MNKLLTVAEALIALGNGEKIQHENWTDDYLIIQGNLLLNRAGDITEWSNFSGFIIYQEFTYPMWFESIKDNKGSIARFDGLENGETLDVFTFDDGEHYVKGYKFEDWMKHTHTGIWKQVEEPKKMVKVAKYAYFNDMVWNETTRYFREDTHYLNVCGYSEFKRLNHTEIEVEDY
jgi:hypothetical protein